jgi:hypothetical protein
MKPQKYIMEQLKIILLVTIFLAAFVPACKKDNDTAPQDKPYRVKEIQDGAEARVFSYDSENRISRINFNGGYFRFTYTSSEITAQTYSSSDLPDPNWKYIFSTSSGRIISGRRYLPNGGIGREYEYVYDDQQRLTTAVMSLKDFTGAEAEHYRYRFFYDAQSLLQQVVLIRKIKTGASMVNSDSTSATLSYFTEKTFMTWKHLGFDFFGSTTAGIELQGMETMPFSFTFIEGIIPSGKAVKLIDTKKYKWNDGASTWSPASTSAPAFSEADYVHDATGRLQQYKDNTIQWEPY